MLNEESGAASAVASIQHSTLNIQHSTFAFLSPPHVQSLARRPVHPRQLFLLLLLHRPQQSVDIRIVWSLLLLRPARLRRRLRLLLRLRPAILLRSAAAALLLLHGLLAA
jgi:hypothetical protein